MGAKAIRDRSIFGPTMNALILYDEFDLAVDAKATLARSVRQADTALWSIVPWRLDQLLAPQAAREALHDAADAHLIVFAINSRTAELPPGLWSWLETWAEGRAVQQAAVAVFDGRNEDGGSAPLVNELSRFASLHGLSFIYGDAHPGYDDSAELVRSFQGSPLDDNSAVLQSMEQSPDGYYRGWGINE